MFLGLDLGSYAGKGVLLDEGFRLVDRAEVPTRGDFSRALGDLSEALLRGRSLPSARIGLTGSGRAAFSLSPEVLPVNDIVALAMGAAVARPEAKSAIEIGAESARWLNFGDGPEGRIEREILDFALNEACAAGSGAPGARSATEYWSGLSGKSWDGATRPLSSPTVAHMVNFAAQAALSRRVRRDFGQIPIPTLVFSGKETVQESTKLEAFIYQVRQSAAQRPRGGGRLELGPAAP